MQPINNWIAYGIDQTWELFYGTPCRSESEDVLRKEVCNHKYIYFKLQYYYCQLVVCFYLPQKCMKENLIHNNDLPKLMVRVLFSSACELVFFVFLSWWKYILSSITALKLI